MGPLGPALGDPLAAAPGLSAASGFAAQPGFPAQPALAPAAVASNGIDPLAEGRGEIEAELDNEIYAAIDLGTNNCRLLIARARGRGFRVIDAFSRIVRLGEGLGANGALSPEAMDRTIEALKICVDKMNRRGVTRARSVATEACRRAANGVAFLNRVEAEVGLRLEIITPQQEAELAFRGCAPLLGRDPRRAILFDIGGGSTEVGWVAIRPGRGIELLAYRSLPLGVVNLAERHGARAYCEKSYGAMVEEVASSLEPLEAQCHIGAEVHRGRVQMLGSSGTVTTLAGIEMQLQRYDRSRVDGAWLDFGAIGSISRRLAAMDCAERAQQPCIGRERADLVVAGCAILEGICRLWPVGRLRVADRGLREGILFGLMQPSSSISPPRFKN
ncbi:exopolyphosphatase [Hypericibacter adhaerens]|uniref:Exopolyphosphatase n=1 Tax=Hypericibacter adhaerens TaxID=2602016 RepID=A0A5J6N3A7_9PROT|nr:exopolyphosphatase [Hypericibacter adhaerens]